MSNEIPCFLDLEGHTIRKIVLSYCKDYILFVVDDNDVYAINDVIVEELCGSLSDLIDTPILVASVVTMETGIYYVGTHRVTLLSFYEISTLKGKVTFKSYTKYVYKYPYEYSYTVKWKKLAECSYDSNKDTILLKIPLDNLKEYYEKYT